MDGIWPGLGPVIPIMFTSGVIFNRSGPKDASDGSGSSSGGSLQPDESAAKAGSLHADPADGQGGAQTPDQTGGENAAQPALGEAYLLSLGDEDPSFPPEGEKQLGPVSSYNRFGRSTAKQAAAPGPGPESTAARPKIFPELNEIRPALRTFAGMRQNDAPVPSAADPVPAGNAGEDAAHTAGEARTASATDPADPAVPAGIAVLSPASAREQAAVSGAPWPAGPSGNRPAAAKPAGENILRVPRNRAPGIIAGEEAELLEQSDGPGALSVRELGSAPDGERVMYGAAAGLGGSMANLEKITQLPYSLYLFGNIPPKPPDGPEGDADPFAFYSGREKGTSAPASAFLRRSEAIKMACVLHSLYYGGAGLFRQETPWYGAYVRYAVGHGIISADDFTDYNGYATRAEAAYIFSNCLPPAELPAVNPAPLPPDVDENTKFASSIRLLCRAGVLTGAGGPGSFRPGGLMTRSEAADIVGRMATPADRKRPR